MTASRIASAMPRVPSRSNIRARCTSTVRVLMPKSWAIILLERPARMPSSTCRSRGLNIAISAAASPIVRLRDARPAAVSIVERSRSSANGFSMKSIAPAFIACTAVATSPCPVITITGSRIPSSLKRACSSSPFIPGIWMSKRMHPPDSCDAASSTTSAEAYAQVANPADSNKTSTDRRKAGSSSTTWTMRSFSIISLLPRHSGKGEAENRPAHWVRFGPKSAAMRLDDLAANGKAEPHAVALGRNERLEQAIRDFGSKAWTGVRNGNLDGFLVPYRYRHNEFAAPALGHRFDPVAHQIDENLLDLNPICDHR